MNTMAHLPHPAGQDLLGEWTSSVYSPHSQGASHSLSLQNAPQRVNRNAWEVGEQNRACGKHWDQPHPTWQPTWYLVGCCDLSPWCALVSAGSSIISHDTRKPTCVQVSGV